MKDYVMLKSEELVESQRRIIEDLRESLSLKDCLIETLHKRISELESKFSFKG
jgi:uncharacterized protein